MTLPNDPVLVRVKATGRKEYKPRHWLDNPVLSRGFEALPSEQQPDLDPDVDVEVDPDDVDAFVDVMPLDPPEDLPDLDTQTSDDTESPDETPA